jgi:hypothetical protein
MHRLAVAVSVLFAVNALAQNVASDPQALAVAQKSLVALTGGAKIGDVTLTGSVELNGTDTGSGVLKALGTEESRVDLTLSTGTVTEVRDAQTGPSRGQWSAQGQNAKAISSRNCQTMPRGSSRH